MTTSRTPIEKKIDRRFFKPIIQGTKTFEIRKEDDHRYEVGDLLRLQEVHDNRLTGRAALVEVKYVLRGEPYLPAGYCCMSIRRLTGY